MIYLCAYLRYGRVIFPIDRVRLLLCRRFAKELEGLRYVVLKRVPFVMLRKRNVHRFGIDDIHILAEGCIAEECAQDCEECDFQEVQVVHMKQICIIRPGLLIPYIFDWSGAFKCGKVSVFLRAGMSPLLERALKIM